MFRATSLGGYRLAPEEREVGRYTFDVLADAVSRALDAGGPPWRPRRGGRALWAAMHGFVMLELAGPGPTATLPQTPPPA